MKNRQLSVLVVDDSLDILELIKFSLEAQTEWRVLVSNSGHEGLIQAQKELPDIILSDVCMPQMNGIEMIGQLRSQPKTEKIPILLLTSLPHKVSAETCYQFGISKVISKPFDAIALPSLIESTFSSVSVGSPV